MVTLDRVVEVSWTCENENTAMRVNCTNCPAQLELGADGEDLGDTAYKHLCPALREYFARGRRHDIDPECPYMRGVKETTMLKYKQQ
jgi:hypothetical protein